MKHALSLPAALLLVRRYQGRPAQTARATPEECEGMQVIVEGPFLGRSRVCEPILRALPQWFGIEEATNQYLKDIEVYPTFLAQAGDDVRGFLTLVEHNAYSAEIHVMGVHPEAHHRGVGGALVQAAECYLRQRGAEYLQVKTLSPRHPDKKYSRTRKFYLAMGFRPLEEFPDLWGPENPCLQMVKSL